MIAVSFPLSIREEDQCCPKGQESQRQYPLHPDFHLSPIPGWEFLNPFMLFQLPTKDGCRQLILSPLGRVPEGTDTGMFEERVAVVRTACVHALLFHWSMGEAASGVKKIRPSRLAGLGRQHTGLTMERHLPGRGQLPVSRISLIDHTGPQGS